MATSNDFWEAHYIAEREGRESLLKEKMGGDAAAAVAAAETVGSADGSEDRVHGASASPRSLSPSASMRQKRRPSKFAMDVSESRDDVTERLVLLLREKGCTDEEIDAAMAGELPTSECAHDVHRVDEDEIVETVLSDSEDETEAASAAAKSLLDMNTDGTAVLDDPVGYEV